MSLQGIVQAVRAVQAVQRVKSVQLAEVSYFTEFDFWNYHVQGSNICERCEDHNRVHIYQGNELLALFPDLEVIGPNEIMVNAHPNCKCYLTRSL